MEAETRTPTVRDSRNDDRIHSWKEIANYLNRTVRTVQRWEHSEHLPVHRRTHDSNAAGPVYAYKSELDAWLLEVFPPNEIREAGEAQEAVEAPALLETPGRAETPPVNRKRILLFTTLGAVVLLSAFSVWKLWPHGKPAVSLEVVRLTDFPGTKRTPALSPDGKYLAFSWNGQNQDNFDIYTRSLYSGTPRRLTQDAATDLSPAWSSDSRLIAFFRRTRASPEVSVIVVPADGGPERKITDCLRTDNDGFPMALTWTPDGKWLIVPSLTTGNASLVLVSPRTLETRPLTTRQAGSIVDCCPALSPDGRTLAFLRAGAGGHHQIFLLSLDRDTRPEGQPKQLTSAPSGVVRPTWVDGGKTLLYLTIQEGDWTLWRVSPSSGKEPERVALLPPIGTDWSMSSLGDLVAFTDSFDRKEIWRMDLAAGGRPVPFITSPRADSLDPQYSPDGKKLAYVSVLPGEASIFVADQDGGLATKVGTTALRRMSPSRWSPDGSRLVFECADDGNLDICTVPATGGEKRRVTRNPARDSLPSWSRDGKWIYFTSDRSGAAQIWKVPSDGNDDEAVQLTQNGGFGAVNSPDGATIYYVRGPRSGTLSRVPASGGAETDLGLAGMAPNLAATGRGIYYASSSSPDQWVEVWRYLFKGGKPDLLGRFDRMDGNAFSVSPDDRYLLFSANKGMSGDIYLVKNPQ